MRRLAALLALLWAAVNVVLAAFMLVSAFTAKTAQHEGLVAQASLLLGGLLIALFGLALGGLCLRMLVNPGTASGT